MNPILVGIVLLSVSSCLLAQNKSVYTGLSDKICKTAEFTEDEGGSYRGICPGVGGYKLELIEGDLRQTIIIVDPKKKEHNLKFWEIFGGFSAVDQKAEWRTKGGKPYALIVRLNVNEDPEKIEKRTLYLLVAKITPTETCVTDVIKPSRTQNVDARRAADAAASKPCYQRP
jgi:hypothetical protein